MTWRAWEEYPWLYESRPLHLERVSRLGAGAEEATRRQGWAVKEKMRMSKA